MRAPSQVVCALLLSLPAGGCLPWVVGETAETVRPGAIRVDVAAAALAPPDDPAALLPVPQLRVAAGVRDGADVALSYVPPLTAHGRARLRLGRTERLAAAGAAGVGVHGVPDVLGTGTRFAVPFATTQLQLSTRGAAPRWYGSLRAIVPGHVGTAPAFTLWLAPQVGIELGEGPLRWAGEAGFVIPTSHPGRTQLVIGGSAGWRPQREDRDR